MLRSDHPGKHASSPDQHQRNLNVALSRALVIHHQKDIEAQILSDVEELADIPSSSVSTSTEADKVIDALASFQPSDFDDLLVERASQSRCAHVFCVNQPRTGKKSRLLGSFDGSEKWCSDACMDKSLWIRPQLATTPAWERQQNPKIALHPHDRSLLDSETPGSSTGHKLITAAETDELARERGDKGVSWKPQHVMTATLVERPKAHPPQPPIAEDAVEQSVTVEGYAPQRAQATSGKTATPSLHATRGLSKPNARNADAQAEEQSWNDMFQHLGKSENIIPHENTTEQARHHGHLPDFLP